ncbi:AAA family ATPase [Candidatus Amarobacter glycogenicus]|uniref:AAA family ATPase n=1 Tax=Candidatus Amarobacter glycogenicus TaxID=3140699 RepID=UPI002A141FE8|nr:ATP-dependent Clp protease ATP-binding subunit [Dehalococcoidia bacterium]
MKLGKADFNSLDVLLQVLSDGICTDEKGERVDLRQSIILLTSNIGFGLNDLGPGRALGFTASTTEVDENWQETARVLMAAGARFRPEFLGRIDRVVVFRQLNVAAVAIARRELGLALGVSGIVGRDLEVRYGNELVDRIALAGCDPRFGARPLVAAIRDQVSAPLARWISARPGIRSRILQLIVDGQDQLRIDDGAYRTLDQFP